MAMALGGYAGILVVIWYNMGCLSKQGYEAGNITQVECWKNCRKQKNLTSYSQHKIFETNSSFHLKKRTTIFQEFLVR